MSEFIPFIRFSQESAAQLLAAYLRGQDIPCRVVEINSAEGNAFQLGLDDQGQKNEAMKIAEEFLANPTADKFRQAAWQTGEVASSKQNMFGKGTLPSRQELLKSPFTLIILAISVFVYLASISGYFGFWKDALSIQYFDQLSLSHQWYRLFGPNFLHFSAMHIVFNLIWWWIFGSQLERVFGSFWLIVLFVVASLFANISQLLFNGPDFGGMSGVVYALFGFVWWIGWLRPHWGISIPNGFVVFLLIWLALGYTDMLFVNMANQAHTFGLISGCLLALSLHILVPRGSAKS